MALLIDHLLTEINHLNNLNHEPSRKEQERLRILQKSIQVLAQLQQDLSQSSLDGGDAIKYINNLREFLGQKLLLKITN